MHSNYTGEDNEMANRESVFSYFQALIENNLYTVGGVAIGIALSQVGRRKWLFN